ncbi:hypothetical protein AB0D08_21315 [Kitasatospora sp. NPDC048540]|uniref:hypothetical protein n=1 Tax=unclassified Kitasatospora TaxID=2633591 RepID=UPI00053B3E96|nr:hypothetical protein [Kitasatospora sp. MBT63]
MALTHARRRSTRIATALTVAAASSLALLATAGTASANQFYGGTLHPGEQRCVQQYAGYQVRGDGQATGQGAKFKIQYNGVTVPGTGSTGLVSAWAAELRSSYGTFPGPGYYTACVTNNGTADTNVRLQLRTDGEFS